MVRSFRKSVVFLFLLFVFSGMLFASIPVSVSICTNSNMEIKYFRDRDYSVRLDPAKTINVNSNSVLYYKYRIIQTDSYSFLGFRIVEYVDGKRTKSVVVPDLGYIAIPEGFTDISIEPIGEYKKRV